MSSAMEPTVVSHAAVTSGGDQGRATAWSASAASIRVTLRSPKAMVTRSTERSASGRASPAATVGGAAAVPAVSTTTSHCAAY